MSNSIKISVRALVEYAFREGSIDSGFRTSSKLAEGTKAHQKIQRHYDETDGKEVYLISSVECDGLHFVLEGRCDGLLVSDGGVTIDEIKSTAKDLSLIEEETYPVHWAQAQCYAYMYAAENAIERMDVQLTYVHVETEELRRYRKTMDFQELESFVLGILRIYHPYASYQLRHEQEKRRSITELPFPFEAYRDGQRRLAGAVYKSIMDGRKLFAKAPTGIGKTISTIFPSVKAIGEGNIGRIFYLTAKTITRTAAEEAFRLLQSKGLIMTVVTITAKDKVCFKEDTNCRKEYCEFADGYYDRINEAMLDILDHEKLLDRETIKRYAVKHKACPFEFSLDVAYAADAVICDYNYIYDPRVSLKRMFEEHKRKTVLLIDEAHNLVDRAREMFSAELSKSDYLELMRLYKNEQPAIYYAAKAVNDHLLSIRKQSGERKQLIWEEKQQDLCGLIEAFALQAEAELAYSHRSDPLVQQRLLDVYFSSSGYVRTAKLYDERFVTYAEIERSEVKVKQLCLDPSHLLTQMGKGYRSAVYFSATLSPLAFYEDMLGGQPDDYSVSIPSPFSSGQLQVFIQPLSTRYRDREASKAPIAAMLDRLVVEHPGNFLVFFPSYEYMLACWESFMEHKPDVKVLLQNPVMSEYEREDFLAAFQEGPKETLVGFAVMGGIFSEGIDLKGERLSGVVIVGVGLPQIGLERNMIKSYYDRHDRNGYDYAYVFPGMNKVLQAGGRLIRSETDKGMLVLVDDRFLQPRYQKLMPEEWRGFDIKPAAFNPAEIVDR